VRSSVRTGTQRAEKDEQDAEDHYERDPQRIPPSHHKRSIDPELLDVNAAFTGDLYG
jgi:hypothetical protein